MERRAATAPTDAADRANCRRPHRRRASRRSDDRGLKGEITVISTTWAAPGDWRRSCENRVMPNFFTGGAAMAKKSKARGRKRVTKDLAPRRQAKGGKGEIIVIEPQAQARSRHTG